MKCYGSAHEHGQRADPRRAPRAPLAIAIGMRWSDAVRTVLREGQLGRLAVFRHAGPAAARLPLVRAWGVLRPGWARSRGRGRSFVFALQAPPRWLVGAKCVN